MRTAKIILFCQGAAIGFGIVHDEITAHISVSYFTVAHPSIFHVQSPGSSALIWGTLGTFWIGLMFGVFLAQVSQSDGFPPIPISILCKKVLALLSIMSVVALLAGIAGLELSCRSLISVPTDWANRIPASQHHRFMAVWAAHAASYASGIVGGTLLLLRIWKARSRPQIISIGPCGALSLLRASFLLIVLCLIAWRRFR